MMKVLLLSPPYKHDFMRNARCDYVSLSGVQWYPIWLSYCGALLEKHGFNVKIIDAPAYNLNYASTKKLILEFLPDILVVYSSTKSQSQDIRFAEEIKESIGPKVFFVGPFVSAEPKVILENSKLVDGAVKGEFEYPILDVANGLKHKDVQGLIFKEDGKIVENSPRTPLGTKELDALPFVTDFYRRHLDLKKYYMNTELFPFVDLFTGRGCIWGRCSFCLWVHSFIPGPNYNKRSIDNVIDEIKSVKRQMPTVKEIFIQDDTLPEERIIEFSESILKEDLKITWSSYLRPNINYETLRLMKRAGCRTVHVGYESANAEVLRRIHKGIPADTMTKFTADAKKAGLRIHGDFLIGLAGETQESIKETTSWAKRINPDTAQFSILNIYPNTPFHEFLKKNNFIRDGEPSYPDLSNEDLRKFAKIAYRRFYFSMSYIKKILKHPYYHLFGPLRSIYKAVPNFYWRHW